MVFEKSAVLVIILLDLLAGYLEFPPSRNYQAFTIPAPQDRYYCPHCGQGGGTGHIPSYAGDPFQVCAESTTYQCAGTSLSNHKGMNCAFTKRSR